MISPPFVCASRAYRPELFHQVVDVCYHTRWVRRVRRRVAAVATTVCIASSQPPRVFAKPIAGAWIGSTIPMVAQASGFVCRPPSEPKGNRPPRSLAPVSCRSYRVHAGWRRSLCRFVLQMANSRIVPSWSGSGQTTLPAVAMS